MPKKKTKKNTKKKEDMKHWLLSVESLVGTDDFFITLPDVLLNSVKWKTGDSLLWTPEGDSWILTKINKK
jgi:hypothetical protein